MPRFAANLSFLFTEVPFLDRFAAAARAGFRGVEFHYPFAVDPVEIRQRLDKFNLTPVLMNIRAGDPTKGEWGFAGIPGREATFRLCVTEAMQYALEVGITQVNCLAGVKPPNADLRSCEVTFVSNVSKAAKRFADAGLTLNIEALNTQDVPGFLISNTRDAMRLIDEIGAENVMLQYDWYHMQIMEGSHRNAHINVLADTMRLLLPMIGHIQFGDVPGRHEPGTGDMDFAALFRHVDAIGYKGWVSAEYRPSGKTEDSLAWMKLPGR
ncbi:MAG: TIM barrel protein [Betaproteobacteria bacterium]